MVDEKRNISETVDEIVEKHKKIMQEMDRSSEIGGALQLLVEQGVDEEEFKKNVWAESMEFAVNKHLRKITPNSSLKGLSGEIAKILTERIKEEANGRKE